MRVLVTGHRGYVGSVLTAVLHHQRFDVAGLDNNWYEGCDFGRTSLEIPEFECDVRDIQFTDLLSFDAVVHLAALSDEATSRADSRVGEEINFHAARRLAELSRQAGVSRFLFASSCAVYGRSDQRLTTERDSASPATAYAKAKLAAERAILSLANEQFSPVVLRFATLYGLSPRLRVDTFINEFAASAIAHQRVDLQNEGAAWRPVVHVEDAARAMAALLRAPREAGHVQILNVAESRENHRVIDVADLISEIAGVSRSKGPAQFVSLSYRADGSNLVACLPGFLFRWTLERGIRQLLDGLGSAGFTAADWRSDRYRRAPRLQALVERNRLDAALRPVSHVVAT